MKIICFCTSWWVTKEDADRKRSELKHWYNRVQNRLAPIYTFIATGSAGPKDLNPLQESVPAIPSFAPLGLANSPQFCDYWACAITAGLWHALDNESVDADMIVVLESDVILGKSFNVTSTILNFGHSDALLLAPQWCGCPDTNFMVFKRAGAAHFLHHRIRPNVNNSTLPQTCGEVELDMIFKGRWFNPWPHIPTIRQDYGYNGTRPDSEMRDLPMVRAPSPYIQKLYEESTG